MFRRDPVAIVLGKDVAQLIHRIIHREEQKEVNAEYHRRATNDDRVLRFDNFTFNWRFRRGENIYNLRCHIVAKLPKNY